MELFSSIFLNVLEYVRIIAMVVSALFIAIAIYAFVRFQELEHEENEHFNKIFTWKHEKKEKDTRWEIVEEHMRSDHPSDWKIAILEADNMLDAILKHRGFKGEGLGERLKQLRSSDLALLDEAWRAHKVRNMIAHQGSDFSLPRADAEKTVNTFYRIFNELGYL